MFYDLITTLEAHPKNMGPMRAASTHAKITGSCGDTVEIWLRIDGGRIQKASFLSNGCGYSVACSSAAAKLVEGMPLDIAKNLSEVAVLKKVGPVPSDHQHCALLAASVVQSAIFDYLEAPPKRSFWQHIRAVFSSENRS